MTPSRPYLLRALYNWILDNGMTPHIVIDANYKGVIVPREHVEDGQIILSVAPESVHGMEMKNHYIAFAARFSGVSRDIYLPIMSITAIYAEENRKGMVFAEEVYDQPQAINDESSNNNNKNDKSSSTVKKLNKSSRPALKIVSSNPDFDNNNNKDKK